MYIGKNVNHIINDPGIAKIVYVVHELKIINGCYKKEIKNNFIINAAFPNTVARTVA